MADAYATLDAAMVAVRAKKYHSYRGTRELLRGLLMGVLDDITTVRRHGKVDLSLLLSLWLSCLGLRSLGACTGGYNNSIT